MSYNNNVPQSGQTLGNTRIPINTNFFVIDRAFKVNHVAFSTSDEGKHKFLQMPEQGSAPSTAINEGGLYTKVGTNPAETNLFFRAENSGGGGGFEYQLTHVINVSTARFGNNTNYVVGPPSINGGWTFLPGGLILQYGKLTFVSQNGTVTFPIAFNSAPFCVQVSLERSSGNQSITVGDAPGPSTTGFNYLSSSSGSAFVHWLAIGN